MKIFTLDEAQALLPIVEALLARAGEAQSKSLRLEARLAALKVRIFHSGGTAVNVTESYRDAAELAQHKDALNEVLEEMASMGVRVKDLERGLLDFPAMLDGEMVLLCWKRGEPQILHWHTLKAGFAGRQKLDSRFRGVKADRPN